MEEKETHVCDRNRMIEDFDELVCPECGRTEAKWAASGGDEFMRRPRVIEYTPQALGSYLGREYGDEEEESAKGFSTSTSTFKYLKTLSDYAGRNGSLYTCAMLMDRICEKLAVPEAVIGQAANIAGTTLKQRNGRGEWTTASISAFSIITACKIHGVTNVGVREIMEAHRALGHRVKASTIIQMSIESPIRPRARKAEEYLGRVVARLPENENLRAALRKRGYNEATYYHKLFATAKRILEMIDGSARGGHSPPALAASSVYAAEAVLAKLDGGRPRFMTQRDMAICANVAEYTVREQYGEIFLPRFDQMLQAIIQEGTTTATQRP